MDYTSDPAQAMYILRYLYGYAYEYKRMYRELLDREPLSGNTLAVTSIGCGNMVDYWSLRTALRERPETAAAVDYTGVDISGWSRRFHIRAASGDRAKFVQMDAAAYLKEPDRAASDVYIFPKSIGEFDGRNTVGGEVLTGIRNGLRDVLRASDKERVWLLISLPQSPYEDYAEKGRAKCAFLREGLEEAGFVTSDPVDAFFTTPEEQWGTIRQADSSFSYPRHILNKFKSFGNCAENRSPVLNTGYERCQALLFQRKR